ncbi:MAG: hypothetical protein JST42_21765 [Bacteroidetes bacterium]|nr:hypothetical protein [Bacteroidota bacterium]
MLPALLNRDTQAYSISIENYSDWSESATILLVKDNFQYTSEEVYPEFFEDADLGKVSMHMSEQSLKEGWENEDDDHWAKFLKEDCE